VYLSYLVFFLLTIEEFCQIVFVLFLQMIELLVDFSVFFPQKFSWCRIWVNIQKNVTFYILIHFIKEIIWKLIVVSRSCTHTHDTCISMRYFSLQRTFCTDTSYYKVSFLLRLPAGHPKITIVVTQEKLLGSSNCNRNFQNFSSQLCYCLKMLVLLGYWAPVQFYPCFSAFFKRYYILELHLFLTLLAYPPSLIFIWNYFKFNWCYGIFFGLLVESYSLNRSFNSLWINGEFTTVLEMKIWIYWSESNSWINFYTVFNKNWKIYWSKQSFTGLGRRIGADCEDCTKFTIFCT
jgi:hypothetical protein